jgi:hypothetical protein
MMLRVRQIYTARRHTTNVYDASLVYSIRKASIGSMEAARRAGMRPAMKAQRLRVTMAPPIAMGLEAAYLIELVREVGIAEDGEGDAIARPMAI